MLRLGALLEQLKFQEARDFQAESECARERAGVRFLDGLTSGRHQRSSNEMVPVGGAPPTWINLPCVNLSA